MKLISLSRLILTLAQKIPVQNSHEHADIYYKYRQIDKRTYDILLNRELWCASPESLNDPLDTQFPLNDLLQSTIDSEAEIEMRQALVVLRDRMVKKKVAIDSVMLHIAIGELVRTAGVLSLSKTEIEALMWSHYGDGHKGICIGYDADFFHGLLDDHKKYDLVGAQEVEYWNIPPFQKFFKENALRLRELRLQGNQYSIEAFISEEYTYELIVSSLLTKSLRWKYEAEYRLIRSQPGPLQFPYAAVKEIIFGAKAADGDIQTLRKLLSGNDWNHVQFKRAKFVDGSFEMAVDCI